MSHSPTESRVSSPAAIRAAIPLPDEVRSFVSNSRQTIQNILQGQDSRLLVIVGPCSIHEPDSALEYAKRLQKIAELYADKLFIVMRTYLEKPRSVLNWKGFVTDPFLNGSYDIESGLKLSRQLLLDILHLKVPTATEFLDPYIAHYLSDLMTWGAIGARTTESQIHRELASHLPLPIGFKNTTDGNIETAIQSILTASQAQHFFSLSQTSIPTLFKTQGNPAPHLILRGSRDSTNFSKEAIRSAKSLLQQAGLTSSIIIDCSHGNSQKNPCNQALVIDSLIDDNQLNRQNVCGVMLESHLNGGNQPLSKDQPPAYGLSITDACLAWEETLPLFKKLAESINT